MTKYKFKTSVAGKERTQLLTHDELRQILLYPDRVAWAMQLTANGQNVVGVFTNQEPPGEGRLEWFWFVERLCLVFPQFLRAHKGKSFYLTEGAAFNLLKDSAYKHVPGGRYSKQVGIVFQSVWPGRHSVTVSAYANPKNQLVIHVH